MVIVASICSRIYIEVGVGTFLPTLSPPKIPSDSDSTALPLSTNFILNYDRNNSNNLIVLIAFFGFVFLPQYV
jgi:hypothetical protein